MKISIRNTTKIETKEARRVVRFICDLLPPLPDFDVQLRNGLNLAGRAYTRGSSYHDNARPFVVLRVPPQRIAQREIITLRPIANYYPRTFKLYQRAHHKGRRYVWANRMEALVYVAAHEIRHLWQVRFPKAGRYHGGRGKSSEVDTESFAIHTLRLWRKQA